MDPSRLASLERNLRLLKTWYLVLSLLLFVSLGANAAWVQAASDPPIRVYTATADDAGAGGSSLNDAIIISPADFDPPLTLLSVTTSHLSNDHGHTCLVTASARVQQTTSPVTALYFFGLSRGEDLRQIGVTTRPVQFVATSDDDVEGEEVTTTFAFTDVRRDETIRFSARYQNGDGSLGVLNPSMTVACLRHSI